MKDLAVVIRLLLVERKDIFVSILCGFIAGITAVGLFSASGYLISRAALTPPIYTLMLLVATVKIFGIISAISRYGERYYSHRGTFTMLSNLRVSFYERLEPLAPRIFQKFKSGDLLARIVGDVETLQNFFLRVFYPPIVILLVFFCTVFFTAYFSIETAIILFIGLVLTTIIVPGIFALRQRKVDHRVREKRGNLSTEVAELFYGFRDLKIYQKLDVKETELQTSAESYIIEQEKDGIQELYSQSLNTFVSLVISLTVLAVGSYYVSIGELDGIFLAMLLMISLTFFENTTSMAAFPGHLEDSRRAASRLSAVVEGEKLPKEGTDELRISSGPSIEFNNITFTYPGEERKAIHGINIQFPAGSKTAIVGPSGSGKSTVLQLLLKIYESNSGEIIFNRQRLSELKQESIWQHTNVVLQENHFFYGTIKDNLLIAGDYLTDYEMNDVLKKVDLEHFTLNDRVLEKGGNLSGGEKQRLSIARAMLKKAPVWILDEPTSAMDSLTENKIYQHLFEAAKNDTLILVSHRLNGLEAMDQIIVMENGKVIEIGSYNELIQSKGYFYELKQIEQNVFRL